MKKLKYISKHKISKGVLAASIGLGLGVTTVIPTHGTTVYASENTVVKYEELAKDFLQKALSQDFDGLLTISSENLKAAVTKEDLATLFAPTIAMKDEFKSPQANETKTNTVHTIVSHTYQTSRGPLNVVVYFNKQGKVDDFNITQPTPTLPYQSPSYDHPETYNENAITIGEGAFATPGTLTMPKGEGPFPVIVLVHGSGPNDQDSTIYGLKPFRDIAVGLAKEGIATIRYEKRTREHPIKATINKKFSIYEETVEDALLAVEFAKSVDKVNSKEIYVLGHSQGGYALPKLINADKNDMVKGVISVSAPNQEFHELIIWQYEEQLKRLEKSGAPAEVIKQQKQAIEMQKMMFADIDNPKYSKDNLPPQLNYWWYDLKDYIPADVAKDQTKPMLMLQGNKDIQVPGSHLDSWKSALSNREDVQYKLYPNMTHVLFNFDGEPTGQEYALPNNVAPELIQDITSWVKTGKISTEPKNENPTTNWENILVKPGQIGRVTITKPINLWTRDKENKLVYVRTLQPNEVYRVYGFSSKYGGQFNLGANHWVTDMDGYVTFEEVPEELKK
ncbi:serine aminopeptidase domain-containing protein [Cytobacillus sp. FJAT-54145]|uniref:Serine aminopeptidase domain-containing protein n=1 Tax=Cytobacillus spartinae TaxID=3299023 RepID=A0ABW6KC01_9BACI